MAACDGIALPPVKVEHASTADKMFSKLTGDVVETRRELIREFALEAAVDA